MLIINQDAPPMNWTENINKPHHLIEQKGKRVNFSWAASYKNEDEEFLDELSRRRISKILGNKSIPYTPEKNEFDEFSLEELIEYEV